MNLQAEENRVLKSLLELLPVGVAIAHDPQCQEVTLNPAASRMLGRAARADELLLQSAVAAGTALRDARVELARSDGTILRACASAAPLRDGDERIIGAVSVFVDSTAEADSRAEQFRELALALADAEARERKRLARALHDDFQQLLSAAKLRAGILRRSTPDDKLQTDATHVEQLLEAAIAASRSLTSELNPPVLYDAGLTPAIEAMVRSLQQQHALRITTHCHPGADPEAEPVRVLLFEAVRELLHNVLRHAGASAAAIRTGLSTDGKVEIEVEDDGKGFDPTRLVFDPSRQKRPFGLLEISERLRWLGGSMQIDSRIGVGTTVRLTVPAALRPPCATTDSGAAPRPETELVVRPPQDTESRPARILVADDHAMFREGLISLLSHEPQFEVVGEAADGQQAVNLARTLKPDILLVDLSMPKMNGLEVTNQLSREMPQLQIVGLSMHERLDMAAAMRSAGATAYLTKDGSSEVLLGVLRKLVPRSPLDAQVQ